MRTEPNVDLTRYVSNLDQNVYTIYNLPEEVIAVIFAYVSRSPAGFRENLAKLLADDELAVNEQSGGMATAYSEKASRFHEKWVVGYGHSSVAEHAVAHIGIEKISRLASAELELANSFNSFTEYSQRYQRPRRGEFYIPAGLDRQPEMKAKYLTLHEKAYDVYEQLMSGLKKFLLKSLSQTEHESDRAFQLRVEKIAFEDARYVLTLSTLTNLGMTGNGRALRDTLVQLLSSRYEECHRLAREMEREISRVIPTLLKYVKPNDYLIQTREHLQLRWDSVQATPYPVTGPRARFTRMPGYREALEMLTARLLLSQCSLSYEKAEEASRHLSLAEHEQIADLALSRLRFFDNPTDELQHLTYQMEMKISEANWHQLLRHNRRTHFSYGQPTTRLGYTIPPHVKEAGLTELFQTFMSEAEQIYQEMEAWNPLLAPYCITNAHHRQVTATASLWELYHLINLRTSPEAQWDIRETFEQLYRELKENHPVLAKYAQRRL
ncbi:FAD-dependent thymidylate synthase [Paenactinomyces guangxiensis]|uniref:FAD-dependent thymidylate synthase n=1 Tax=Paenactinomyces guangxiensis TaxID=1490290 RepID=A0A7W1WPI8_9BACL|nr:FAD-dependent thymidylate synthase [Paenactinomyces guangxiensis]MBA4493686.1 FAD-dependent thymidylate synthase [Paenactinomyces guangxiensis]MBH8590973.1 FAD-dependent thymidylate synthase [Paenactinomyces guangxiensis]